MSVFDEAQELFKPYTAYQWPYDVAAGNLGVPEEQGRDAVREWFRERGYAPVPDGTIVDEDLESGVYIIVDDNVYKCVDNSADSQLFWYPDAMGETEFDELDYTGYKSSQIVWDKDENKLWLVKVG